MSLLNKLKSFLGLTESKTDAEPDYRNTSQKELDAELEKMEELENNDSAGNEWVGHNAETSQNTPTESERERAEKLLPEETEKEREEE